MPFTTFLFLLLPLTVIGLYAAGDKNQVHTTHKLKKRNTGDLSPGLGRREG